MHTLICVNLLKFALFWCDCSVLLSEAFNKLTSMLLLTCHFTADTVLMKFVCSYYTSEKRAEGERLVVSHKGKADLGRKVPQCQICIFSSLFHCF